MDVLHVHLLPTMKCHLLGLSKPTLLNFIGELLWDRMGCHDIRWAG